MEKKFKIGDVVQLNSGSVNMTVKGFGFLEPEGDTVKLFWYNEMNCEFESGEFREDILRLVTKKEELN